jgi:hypothetical protein
MKPTAVAKITSDSTAVNAMFGKKEIEDVHKKCLFRNAKPEPVFKYFSI